MKCYEHRSVCEMFLKRRREAFYDNVNSKGVDFSLFKLIAFLGFVPPNRLIGFLQFECIIKERDFL